MRHRALIGLTTALVLIGAFLDAARAGDIGLITVRSRYSVEETVKRFEAAVELKSSLGFTVFAEIDHAAAAKKFSLTMRPRTVIVFGNPKLGTPVMVKTPTLAIDVPPKALVWEDDQGAIWLTYNSAEYLGKVIYARHGLSDPPTTPNLAAAFKEFADYATK